MVLLNLFASSVPPPHPFHLLGFVLTPLRSDRWGAFPYSPQMSVVALLSRDLYLPYQRTVTVIY